MTLSTRASSLAVACRRRDPCDRALNRVAEAAAHPDDFVKRWVPNCSLRNSSRVWPSMSLTRDRFVKNKTETEISARSINLQGYRSRGSSPIARATLVGCPASARHRQGRVPPRRRRQLRAVLQYPKSSNFTWFAAVVIFRSLCFPVSDRGAPRHRVCRIDTT